MLIALIVVGAAFYSFGYGGSYKTIHRVVVDHIKDRDFHTGTAAGATVLWPVVLFGLLGAATVNFVTSRASSDADRLTWRQSRQMRRAEFMRSLAALRVEEAKDLEKALAANVKHTEAAKELPSPQKDSTLTEPALAPETPAQGALAALSMGDVPTPDIGDPPVGWELVRSNKLARHSIRPGWIHCTRCMKNFHGPAAFRNAAVHHCIVEVFND